MTADKTFIAEILLGPCEFLFFTVGGQFIYWSFPNITQSPVKVDKKITAKHIAVVFDNDILAATSLVCTDRMPPTKII